MFLHALARLKSIQHVTCVLLYFVDASVPLTQLMTHHTHKHETYTSFDLRSNHHIDVKVLRFAILSNWLGYRTPVNALLRWL